MSDRPILFSAPMVRAIFDGRKTQTRRIIRGVRRDNTMVLKKPTKTMTGITTHVMDAPEHGLLPYAVGDRLWVKETWRTWRDFDTLPPRDLPNDAPIFYEEGRDNCDRHGRIRQSCFMTRRASRLTLHVTDVRVQLLRDISEEDAQTEGLTQISKDGQLSKWGIPDRDGYPGSDNHGLHWCEWRNCARDAFRNLWDRLNAKRGLGWETNPWIVALSFETHRCNIDAMPAVSA